MRAAFTGRPLSSRLPVSYQVVPPWLRSLIAAVVGRMRRGSANRWAEFPGWPLDLSADFAADLAGGPPARPPDAPAPVVLSHDLDSREGAETLVRRFLAVEEAAGARSVNFVVPCRRPLDHGLLAEIRARGHEIGIHGYDHGNRTAFAGETERERRVAAAADLIARYDASGYRSPSLLRTRDLLRTLARRYRYDSSIPTSGGLFPTPNNGCATARPFEVEGIAELPLSLPRDGSLRFLGHSPETILKIWIECAETIAAAGGVVVLLTHCEERFSGNEPMLNAYRAFLDHLAASPRFSWSSPAGVLKSYLGKGS